MAILKSKTQISAPTAIAKMLAPHSPNPGDRPSCSGEMPTTFCRPKLSVESSGGSIVMAAESPKVDVLKMISMNRCFEISLTAMLYPA